MNAADDMEAKSKAYNFDPDNIAPPEVQQQLWELLKWRDNIYRDIIKKIEMVPGLSDLIENLTNALNACACPCHCTRDDDPILSRSCLHRPRAICDRESRITTSMDRSLSNVYFQPILEQVTTALSEGSKAVIDTDDQYQVRMHGNGIA